MRWCFSGNKAGRCGAGSAFSRPWAQGSRGWGRVFLKELGTAQELPEDCGRCSPWDNAVADSLSSCKEQREGELPDPDTRSVHRVLAPWSTSPSPALSKDLLPLPDHIAGEEPTPNSSGGSFWRLMAGEQWGVASCTVLDQIR